LPQCKQPQQKSWRQLPGRKMLEAHREHETAPLLSCQASTSGVHGQPLQRMNNSPLHRLRLLPSTFATAGDAHICPTIDVCAC
jgi:hypothetical protein